MSCTIIDKALAIDNSGAPVPQIGQQIRLIPATQPVFVKIGGVLREILVPTRPITIAGDGTWTTVGPWPSECDPTTALWDLLMPDGTRWRGAFPEGLAGPFTVSQLKTSYGWILQSTATNPVLPALTATASLEINQSGASDVKIAALSTGGNILEYLRIQPQDPASAGDTAWHEFVSGSVNPADSARKDFVMLRGWNVNNGGGSFDGVNAATWDAYEQYYAPSGTVRQVERHIAFATAASVQYRPFSTIFQYAPSLQLSTLMYQDVVTLGPRDQASFWFQIYDAGGIGQSGQGALHFAPGSFIRKMVNNQYLCYGLNAAANGFIAMIRNNANDQVEIDGVGSAGTLVNGALQLGSNALGTATAANVGSFKYLAGGGGVADKLYMSLKAAAGTYSWVQIVTG